MVNAYTPHVLVLPEDQANRSIVTGFMKGLPDKFSRNIMALHNAGGWENVRDKFKVLIPGLEKFPGRRVILLMDFDGKFPKRSKDVISTIPDGLRNRVFLLGTADEPDKLKSALRRPYEAIGKELAEACASGLDGSLWQHEQLRHNQPELERLVSDVRPVLFG